MTKFEEMKSRIDRAETANAGMELYWFRHRLLNMLLEQKIHFTAKRVFKIKNLTRIRNQYPIVTLNIAGLRIYNGKNVFVKSWIIVTGRRHMVPSLE